MKIRAFLLLALVIGGAYMMIQTYQNKDAKAFTEILNEENTSFHSLTFTKPLQNGTSVESWVVEEPKEIELLLSFLQNYHVRKLQPEEIRIDDPVHHFSIRLHDEKGNELNIMVNEDLIIQDETRYYEVVDGPLDVNWLLSFFINNQ